MGQTYRCPVCAHPIFTGEGLAGSLKMPCPNRECPSRRGRPVQQHKFVFGQQQQPKR